MWKPIQRRRMAEEVAQQLRGLILQGAYKPGDRLPAERKLSESLGVNRSTLREALHTLEQAGLVRIRQGDGTRVLDFVQTAGLDLLGHLIPLSDSTRHAALRDILEFRLIAGQQMARLAAGRVTTTQLSRLQAIADKEASTAHEVLLKDLDFYFELARATGNMVFPLLFNPVRSAVRRFARFFAGAMPGPAQVQQHHRALIQALDRGDPEQAARAAGQHLSAGMELLMEQQGQGSGATVLEPEER